MTDIDSLTCIASARIATLVDTLARQIVEINTYRSALSVTVLEHLRSSLETNNPSFYCFDLNGTTLMRTGIALREYVFYEKGEMRVCGKASTLSPLLQDLGLSEADRL